MLADAQERLFVEARLIDGQAQQFRGAVEIADQAPHPTADMIAVATERNLDRLLVEGAVKSLGIERPGAFIKQAAEQRRRARLAGRVLRRAALEGEFDRDQRHGVVFDQPSLDPARRDDLLDRHGARDGLLMDECGHEWFQGLEPRGLRDLRLVSLPIRREGAQAAAFSSGRRKPLTALRRSRCFLAASSTAAAPTASIRAGHCLTSSMVRPVDSDAPYQRANMAWLSCA